MALQDSSDSPPEIVGDEEQPLKYLEGVQNASVHAIACVSNLYEYVKEKSGPLKPGVQTVEGTVKSVVGPAYDKFHHVPNEVLKLVDSKVDESVTALKQLVPASVKEASSKAVSAAQKAPARGCSMTSDLTQINVTHIASVYAKELYTKYEPAAEQYAASAWRKLNQLPVFPKVAEAVIPTAANCVEKYNQTVQSTAEKGYKVSSYLPLVPTEKIAKVFSSSEAASVDPPKAATHPGESSLEILLHDI
ncbi:unnamed protein product [Rhodiola kirilowii]